MLSIFFFVWNSGPLDFVYPVAMPLAEGMRTLGLQLAESFGRYLGRSTPKTVPETKSCSFGLRTIGGIDGMEMFGFSQMWHWSLSVA